MANEADTCRTYVVPLLRAAGWDTEPHSVREQVTFTDGRIIPIGNRVKRGKQKRADYVLRYRRDFALAVVEAKAEYKIAGDGMQQAKDYAEILGLKFAYATNGRTILEYDYLTGRERGLTTFPTPDELWRRLHPTADDRADRTRLEPFNRLAGKTMRYYQEIAVNRIIDAVLTGEKRVLVTMATGTGKTMVAFQTCWKLWNSRWNRAGLHRRPKILYLSDRNILVDDPKAKAFAPFEEARHKIENGEVIRSREMYFAIYQALAGDETRAPLYEQFPRDFFDLVIVDECHRGSARDDSAWREILNYLHPAVQLGMTATPLREESRDTYAYFGNPIYTYSLRQGIEDGFLAPYRVHRIMTDVDVDGWRPTLGELDRYGRQVPDDEYVTKDFERVVALRARTEAIARHLTNFLKQTDRFAKTIVFCVDQEHADEMRRMLHNLNADLTVKRPNYVCRVTADEGEIGRGHLGKFQDPEERTPVILTTSQLLTTGVDAPMVKNIVLARVVGSMAEFKQIIGRGTRVLEDYGKLYFNILDYTGAATRNFADPAFDGDPALIAETQIDANGEVVETEVVETAAAEEDGQTEHPDGGQPGQIIRDPGDSYNRRKYYVDGGEVEIVGHIIYELDPQGRRLGVVRYSDYTGATVRTLYPAAPVLRQLWADPAARSSIIAQLAERNIDFAALAEDAGQPDADPFDLLCHVAYNAPLRTRRERMTRLRQERKDFFDRYNPDARAILEELLEKYAAYGVAQFEIPDALKLPPISRHGNVMEIARIFGGTDQLRQAMTDLQQLLYAA